VTVFERADRIRRLLTTVSRYQAQKGRPRRLDSWQRRSPFGNAMCPRVESFTDFDALVLCGATQPADLACSGRGLDPFRHGSASNGYGESITGRKSWLPENTWWCWGRHTAPMPWHSTPPGSAFRHFGGTVLNLLPSDPTSRLGLTAHDPANLHFHEEGGTGLECHDQEIHRRHGSRKIGASAWNTGSRCCRRRPMKEFRGASSRSGPTCSAWPWLVHPEHSG